MGWQNAGMDAVRLHLRTDRTHLFPGARLTVEEVEEAADGGSQGLVGNGSRGPGGNWGRRVLRPASVHLAFIDGVEVEAELLQIDDPSAGRARAEEEAPEVGGATARAAGADAEFVLEVPEFRTGAGAAIPAKAWSISRVENVADEFVLVLGRRVQGA